MRRQTAVAAAIIALIGGLEASSADGAATAQEGLGRVQALVNLADSVTVDDLGDSAVGTVPTATFEYRFTVTSARPRPIEGGVVSSHQPGPAAEERVRSRLERLLGDLPGERERFITPMERIPIHSFLVDLPESLMPRLRSEVEREYPNAALTTRPAGLHEDDTTEASSSVSASSGWNGWAPDFGTWFYVHKSSTSTSFGGVHHYKAQVTMSWDSASQLQDFSGNPDSGFEMNMSYFRHTPGVEESASGDTSVLADWASDFPGAYREVITIDDDQITYAVGTHEADKLRWKYEANANFFEDYFVVMNIDDPANYNSLGSRKPLLTLYAQRDLDMACGGTFADACFASDASHNYLGGGYDRFPVYPVFSWNYI